MLVIDAAEVRPGDTLVLTRALAPVRHARPEGH